VSMENRGGMMSTGETPDSSTRAILILPALSYSIKSGGNGERNDEFCLTKYLFRSSKGFLTCRKVLRHGPTALLPLRRKACYGVLSPLKIHRHRPGLNSRTSGSVASSLTTRPPRTTCYCY
jgi:hypothetical protein